MRVPWNARALQHTSGSRPNLLYQWLHSRGPPSLRHPPDRGIFVFQSLANTLVAVYRAIARSCFPAAFAHVCQQANPWMLTWLGANCWALRVPPYGCLVATAGLVDFGQVVAASGTATKTTRRSA